MNIILVVLALVTLIIFIFVLLKGIRNTNNLSWKRNMLISEIFLILNSDNKLEDTISVSFKSLDSKNKEIQITNIKTKIKKETFDFIMLRLKNFAIENNIVITVRINYQSLEKDRYGNIILKEEKITLEKDEIKKES